MFDLQFETYEVIILVWALLIAGWGYYVIFTAKILAEENEKIETLNDMSFLDIIILSFTWPFFKDEIKNKN